MNEVMNEVIALEDNWKLAPELVEVSDTYLSCGCDIDITAKEMDIPREKVAAIISKKEVKRYIDNVFFHAGYMNRSKIMSVMEDIVEKKLEEMEEAELTSSKDIVDIMQMIHKMRMDEVKASKDAASATVYNTQVNTGIDTTSNYGALMDKLMGK